MEAAGAGAGAGESVSNGDHFSGEDEKVLETTVNGLHKAVKCAS